MSSVCVCLLPGQGSKVKGQKVKGQRSKVNGQNIKFKGKATVRVHGISLVHITSELPCILHDWFFFKLYVLTVDL